MTAWIILGAVCLCALFVAIPALMHTAYLEEMEQKHEAEMKKPPG